MKYLIVLALVFSGCATTPTRNLRWKPVDETGKTEASVQSDWEVCRQKAHYSRGSFETNHARCMLANGYVMVELVD